MWLRVWFILFWDRTGMVKLFGILLNIVNYYCDMGLLVFVIDIECKPFGFEVLCKESSKKRFCFVRAETEFKIKETSNYAHWSCFVLYWLQIWGEHWHLELQDKTAKLSYLTYPLLQSIYWLQLHWHAIPFSVGWDQAVPMVRLLQFWSTSFYWRACTQVKENDKNTMSFCQNSCL